jgi:hypothetical protein
MRLLLVTGLLSRSLADVCENYCKQNPGTCGSNGSFCKNGHACHDLFWFDEQRTFACSSAVPGCPTSNPVLCRHVSSILTPKPGEATGEPVKKAVATTEAPPKKGSMVKSSTKSKEEEDLAKAVAMSPREQKQGKGSGQKSSSGDRKPEDKKKGKASASAEDEELQAAIAESLKQVKSGTGSPKSVGEPSGEDDDLERALAESLGMGAVGEIVKDARPGRLGFENMGATCYLATVMQLLSHARPLVEGLHLLRPDPVAEAVADIFDHTWNRAAANEGAPILPAALLAAINAKAGDDVAFTAGHMEDVMEALDVILDSLAVATRPAPFMPSFAETLFMSVVRNTKHCVLCNVATVREEPTFNVLVPVPTREGDESVTLEECFTAMHTDEQIPDYACDTCGGYTVANAKSALVSGSPLMFVGLRRFRRDMSKVHTPVEIPAIMRLEDDSVYELIGIAHHHGETKNGGHYIAEFLQDGEWVEANDRAVVAKGPGPEKIVSKTAYVLLYQRQA